MDSATIAKMGILFLCLGLAATFLMYWLWGFPFDKATRTSSAPKPLMYTHRVLGYLFVFCYIAIMWHMVPRLWEYQVEFPARTVAHIILGSTIGFLLVLKIAIMRFFRHFEEWMPYLGTSIMLFTVLLLGLSIPFVFRERALASSAPGGTVYSQESMERLSKLLPTAGMPKEASLTELVSESSLREGRRVLLDECVKCHDLKTILARPRTPSNWYRVVDRMASKPALFDPITLDEQWQVTSYLVAITPDLKESVKQIRAAAQKQNALEVAAASAQPAEGPIDLDALTAIPMSASLTGVDVDPAQAQALYEDVCSQCHELSDVTSNPPTTDEEIDEVVQRMIENDMEAEIREIAVIKWHMRKTFVDQKD